MRIIPSHERRDYHAVGRAAPARGAGGDRPGGGGDPEPGGHLVERIIPPDRRRGVPLSDRGFRP